MKIEATPDDLRVIKNLEDSSLMARWLRNKDATNFTIGDILVKDVQRGWGNDIRWETEKASQRSTQPAKYVYLYRDSSGIGYVKKLSADGKNTIGYPQSLFDIDLDRVKFKVDPDFQDAILLESESYDPAKAHLEEKKLRAEIREYNMKQVLKVKSEELLIGWLKTNKGRQMWVGADRTGDHFQEYTIGDVVDKQNYQGTPFKVVELTEADGDIKLEQTHGLFASYIIFFSRPRSVKDYK